MGLTMSKPTNAQRDLIERLCKRADMDPNTLTAMHKNAGCPDHLIGQPVTHWLDSLTRDTASLAISKLQRLAAR